MYPSSVAVSTQHQDKNPRVSHRFCPPEHGPIDGWLAPITSIGGNVVSLDGRVLPRIRDCSREPWETNARYLELDVDADTPSALLADWVIEHETRKAVLREAAGHPGRNAHLCLEAAHMRRITATDLAEIGAYLELAPQGDHRNTRRVIRRGDQLWASLGAWPWALYEDGGLPARWRTDPAAAQALMSWYENGYNAAAGRLRRETVRLRQQSILRDDHV